MNILLLAVTALSLADSLLYAVYDYFRRYCGCVYFWDGDVMPKRASLPVKGVAIEEQSRFVWRGAFVRRDACDLARTILDRLVSRAYVEMMTAYRAATADKSRRADAVRKADACLRYMRSFTAVLAMHADYSLTETLERMQQIENMPNPEIEKVWFENSSCDYCLAHQAEYAKALYLPRIEKLVARLKERLARGDFSPLPPEPDPREELRTRAHPIRGFAPDKAARTPENWKRALQGSLTLTVEPGGMSVEAALEAIRAARAADETSTVTVVIRGENFLAKTLRFDARDHDIVFVGEQDAALSGGIRVNGWRDRGDCPA